MLEGLGTRFQVLLSMKASNYPFIALNHCASFKAYCTEYGSLMIEIEAKTLYTLGLRIPCLACVSIECVFVETGWGGGEHEEKYVSPLGKGREEGIGKVEGNTLGKKTGEISRIDVSLAEVIELGTNKVLAKSSGWLGRSAFEGLNLFGLNGR